MNRSRLGLNALSFLTAAVQTGFGPFIAVWLTQQNWGLGSIGFALSVGTFAALLSQLPGGVLVDQVHHKRLPAAAALIALGLSALMLSLSPTRPMVWGAEIVHAFASSILTPSIAALTLTLCGHDGYSQRLGVNTRYASLGNAASAALLGLAAAAWSEHAVFFVTAALAIPTLGSLLLLRPEDRVDPNDHPALRSRQEREHWPWQIFAEPALHVFALAVVLFQLANAALLPMAINSLAQRHEAAGYIISATVIVPQVITALIAPWAGRLAQRIGRRPVLLAGFAAVPARALLFATLPGAVPLVIYQALDGLGAAVIGLMLPLIAADLTRRTGYLNFAIGALGLAAGLGSTISTALAGWSGDRFGEVTTFLFLAAVGGLGLLLVALLLPETRAKSGRQADAPDRHALRKVRLRTAR